MSLNPFERALFGHLQDHPEELRHWQAKIAGRAAAGGRAASVVADDLADYCRERGAHHEPFREWEARGGVPRSSLLNLAEYLLRMWGATTPRRRPDPPPM